MISYSDDAVIRWLNKKEKFAVEIAFDAIYKGQPLVTVPQGFETDLASIPQWAESIVPKLGHHVQPAVVHDFMYVHVLPGIDKAFADKVFLHSMLSQGVRKTRAWLMYAAVLP